MTSLFTCIACRLAFSDAEVQRLHYKTDWHRYNLKRKIADLAPVTMENFNERVLQQRAQVDAEDAPPPSQYCDSCRKKFSSDGAYQSHLQSARHRQNASAAAGSASPIKTKPHASADERSPSAGQDQRGVAAKQEELATMAAGKSADVVEMEEGSTDNSDGADDEYEGDALGIEECLFCSHVSASTEDNLMHMSNQHGFFVPDAEYLVDAEGLLSHLGEKVGVGKMCLWCNDKGHTFYATKAVQQHMIDKGHCKMLFEGDAVYEFSDFYDYRSSYPDDGIADENGDLPVVPTDLEVQEDDYRLALPSGATVGHRSLMRFYRQNLVSRFHPNGQRQIMNKVLSGYRALGWTGAVGEATEQRVRDIAFVQRLKSKHMLSVGIKGNKLQRHYRRQDMRF